MSRAPTRRPAVMVECRQARQSHPSLRPPSATTAGNAVASVFPRRRGRDLGRSCALCVCAISRIAWHIYERADPVGGRTVRESGARNHWPEPSAPSVERLRIGVQPGPATQHLRGRQQRAHPPTIRYAPQQVLQCVAASTEISSTARTRHDSGSAISVGSQAVIVVQVLHERSPVVLPGN